MYFLPTSWISLVVSLQWEPRFLLSLHSAVCLTTGPQPLPKRVFHRVRSSASFSNFQWPFCFRTLSRSCLSPLPCLHVTSIPSPSFPSIVCLKRRLIRKTWPIQLAFLLFILSRMFLPPPPSFCAVLPHLSHDQSKWSSPSFSRYLFSTFPSVQFSAPYNAMLQMYRFTSFYLKFKSNFLIKKKSSSLCFECCFAVAIVALISHVHLADFYTWKENLA
jgi:hypothetical protein